MKGAGVEAHRKNQRFCLIRDLVGTHLGYIAGEHAMPSMDAAAVLRPVFDAKYSAEFELEGEGGYFILFERDTFAGEFQMEVNGYVIDKSLIEQRALYDFNNHVIPVRLKRRNRIVVRWNGCDEFDGLRSSIHVVRDFARRRAGQSTVPTKATGVRALNFTYNKHDGNVLQPNDPFSGESLPYPVLAPDATERHSAVDVGAEAVEMGPHPPRNGKNRTLRTTF